VKTRQATLAPASTTFVTGRAMMLISLIGALPS
jgi:hypothetical protein